MNGNLTFPDDDAKEFAQDCDYLRDVIMRGPEVHCAWLRALKSPQDSRISSSTTEWQDEHTKAVLEYGIAGSHSKGLISSSLLRQLAYNPDLLESLAERVLDDGNLEHWLPSDAESSEKYELDELGREFLEQLRQEMDRVPSIFSSDLQQTFEGTWEKELNIPCCHISVPVVDDSTLTLRFLDRTWGKLRVNRQTASLLAIVARTGVFLTWPPASSLQVRAAASTPAGVDLLHETPIELHATKDGLMAKIFIMPET